MPPERVRAIILAVCEERGISLIRLMRDDRTDPAACRARWEVWTRLRALRFPNGKPPSYLRIGAWFSRNHVTVMHGVKRLEEEAHTPLTFKAFQEDKGRLAGELPTQPAA